MDRSQINPIQINTVHPVQDSSLTARPARKNGVTHPRTRGRLKPPNSSICAIRIKSQTMGYRSRSATPGTILCLAATVLLAIVSFNTPLLKSLYFLQANYSTGQYAGTLTLGTLGYCLTTNGATNCVGPTVGYEFSEFFLWILKLLGSVEWICG